MSELREGMEAPQMALPQVGGDMVELVKVPGRRLLWFSRGFGCPFCRRSMAQLSVIHDQLQALEVDVIQVAPNALEAAERYYGSTVPFFPMLCDPELKSHRAYGLHNAGPVEALKNGARSAGQALATGEVVESVRATAYDMVNIQFVERFLYYAATAYDQALLYLVDGVVQRHWLLKTSAALSPNREILQAIAECDAAASAEPLTPG